MGLDITVGMPDRRQKYNQQFISLFNKIAEENDSTIRFDASRKPYHKPVLEVNMGGYDSLHYLRLQAARIDVVDAAKETLYKDAFLVQYQNQHLINHEDNQGYYIPVDFDEPVWTDLPEQSIGSSVQLDQELDRVWPHLKDSELPKFALPSELDRFVWNGRFRKHLQKIIKEYDVPKALAREEYTWLKLKLAAQKSIQFGLPIIFH